MPARLAALLIPLLPASYDTHEPVLVLEYQASALEFRVSGPDTMFAGAVILSLDSSLCHYFQGLPPLLCNHGILAAGIAREEFVATVSEQRLPPGVVIYAQGVIADEHSIQSTGVIDFVLDGSLPGSD